MATVDGHSMPSSHKHHEGVISATLSSVVSADSLDDNADNHSVSNHFCEHDKNGCSSMGSACAAHCATSVINKVGFCFPEIEIAKFEKVVCTRCFLSVSLAGPFKPPR